MTQMCFFNQCIDFTLRDFLFEAVKFNKYAGTDKGKCGYSSKVLDLAQNQIFLLPNGNGFGKNVTKFRL